MILTRLFLNGASRDVQRCIGDAHHLHARVMSMYPPGQGREPREKLGILHRLEVSEREGTIVLLVQSPTAPALESLPAGFLDPRAGDEASAAKSLDVLHGLLSKGARLRFRLRANPARKIDTKTGADGVRRNGRRVPLRGDEARVAWLARKLRDSGLRLVVEGGSMLVVQRPEGLSRGRRNGLEITHEAHVFEGVVEVDDPALAWAAVQKGIGPGKAFGFGLLSLAGA